MQAQTECLGNYVHLSDSSPNLFRLNLLRLFFFRLLGGSEDGRLGNNMVVDSKLRDGTGVSGSLAAAGPRVSGRSPTPLTAQLV